MSLCIPYNVIEPIMGVLAAQNWFSYQRKGGQEDHVRKLTRNVNNAPVEMRAFLAQTTIRLQELLSLQVGDLITTDKPIDKDVLIQVEGRNKFTAQVGQLRGNKSVRIMRICNEPAEPPAAQAQAPGAPAAAQPAPAQRTEKAMAAAGGRR
jgi:flagellar motor switch protein FliM